MSCFNSEELDGLEGVEFTVKCTSGLKAFQNISVLSCGDSIVDGMPIVLEVKCICGNPDCNFCGRSLVMKLSLPSESRQEEHTHINHARKQAEQSASWALKHLPDLLDSATVRYDEMTRNLAKVFGTNEDPCEPRIFRVTIMEKLEPLEALEDLREYAQVFYDILQVHRWLYTDAKILHRDLSRSNIMFRRSADKIYGVLNDFDLASRLDVTNDGATSNHRAGTRPYMALDLLDTKRPSHHMYRHDLESLFYIILCLACRYEKPGRRLKDPPFSDWFWGTERNLFVIKNTLITTNETPTISPHFCAFSLWLIPMYKMLFHGVIQQRLFIDDDGFDLETLGGEFTYDKVKTIMSTFDGKPLEDRWS